MNISLKYTWISRIMLILFLLYRQVFSYLYNNRIIEFGLLGIALILQLIEDGFYLRGKTSLWLLAFAFASLIFSAIVAVDVPLALTYVFNFLEFTVVFYLVHRYSAMDGNIRFSLLAFVVLAVVMALMNLALNTGAERMTFSESLNVNAVGIVCMFGIAYLLYLLIGMKKNPFFVVLVVLLVTLLAFVVVKTVSKKAMIAAGVLIAFWLLFCYRQAFGKQNVLLRILLFVGLIVGMVLAYRWFLRTEAESVEYITYRFEQIELSGDTSAEMRYKLIILGFQTFLDHPIIGVGLNNFRFYNEYATYAHCFYAELFACTGIVGGFLLGMPIVRSLAHYIRALLKKKQLTGVARTETWFMLALYVTVLVLMWTQILFYELPLMYAFAILTAYIETLDERYKAPARSLSPQSA